MTPGTLTAYARPMPPLSCAPEIVIPSADALLANRHLSPEFCAHEGPFT